MACVGPELVLIPVAREELFHESIAAHGAVGHIAVTSHRVLLIEWK